MSVSETNQIYKAFSRDGFFGPLDILAPREAEEALIEVQTELSREGSSRFKLHLILPSISRIAHHPKLIKAVRAALNSNNIMLWSSDVNIKDPKSPGFYAPHQDCTYAGLYPSCSILTAWIALSDPVGMKEGCLRFYPESHELNQLPHVNEKNTDNLLVMGQCINNDVMRTLNEPTHIELSGGQATLHSFNCVHASSPNESDGPRVGLALRYMTGDVRQTKPSRETATWICGEKSDHFDIEPKLPDPPSANDIKIGRDAQRDGLLREDSNYFANHDQQGSGSHSESVP